ncbi:hypothetical protein LCGC14_0351310 [marine sediment metagenome]|uniref:Uncharacterized protein n=1 Tax=marine sediment metagenome TaxID=412755 RepID=A0A0F9TTL7_9ZZZZ
MSDKSNLWKQPKMCGAGVPEGSYSVKGRLACWEDCCKAYCSSCSFYIKDDVLVDEKLLSRDWNTPEEDKAWKHL